MSETEKTITIDGKRYALDSLPQAAKTQLVNVRAVDEEIKKVEQTLAIYRTARAAYARALQEELQKIEASH